MGRHADGQPNYRVAKGPLILLLVAILVGALAAAWWVLSNDDDDGLGADGECIKGDLTLIVGADPSVIGAARDKVREWGESGPVVRDYCVRPQLMVSGSEQVLDDMRAVSGDGGDDAAAGGTRAVLPTVWMPADASFVDRARDIGAVGVDEDVARLSDEPVGIAVPEDRAGELGDVAWEELAGREDFTVATPGGIDAVVSSVVNARLEPGMEGDELLAASEQRITAGGEYTSDALMGQLAAGTAEGFDAVAATQSMVDMAAQTGAEGLRFVSPADSPSLSAPVAAFTSGGPIDETAARAAAEFLDFVHDSDDAGDSEAGDSAADSPLNGPAGTIVDDLADRTTDPMAEPPAGTPGAGPAPTDPTSPADPADAADVAPAGSTLVLLDTSTDMNLDAVRESLMPLLDRAIDGEGRRVALWNYSSPVSAEASSPVRPNVYFGPGAKDRSKEVLGRLDSIGEPWLWRSIGPAHEYVRDAWVPGVVNRVVLVTSGSDATDDDPAETIAALREAASGDRPVRVDVVVTGGDDTDGALADLAEATGGAVHPAGDDLTGALTRGMGL
ncbi:vWA domain-containing protein [uncultured Corynebacterium sp.]|uniref:vWA domain-containing protein n=1 Tax=uncultured Corynebacterium sp. TaxID=159447 RepID=UPI0025E9B3BB|nr:vWA domain-containing protein [uncultured Corynebacterium sp.]